MAYGEFATGLAPNLLLEQRRTVAAASAPPGGTSGQNIDLVLTLADGSSKGRADPAYAAHTLVIGFWAMNIWNTWIAAERLEAALAATKARMICHDIRWQTVADRSQQWWQHVLESVGWCRTRLPSSRTGARHSAWTVTPPSCQGSGGGGGAAVEVETGGDSITAAFNRRQSARRRRRDEADMGRIERQDESRQVGKLSQGSLQVHVCRQAVDTSEEESGRHGQARQVHTLLCKIVQR